MIDEVQARRVAEDTIRRFAEVPGVPPLAIIRSADCAVGWVFFYESVAYTQTRRFGDMVLGNAPVVVVRSTGQPHVTGTAHSLDHYLAELDGGSHTCKLCRDPAGSGRPSG